MSGISAPNPKYSLANGRFSIQHMKRKGVTAMPRPHSHEYVELYFLREGERVYFVDDRVVTVRKGELILIPAGRLHATASSDIAEFERILVNFDPLLLPQALRGEDLWFHRGGCRLFRLTLREQEHIQGLLSRILDECFERRPHYESCAVALFTELLIVLQRSEGVRQTEAPKHPLHHLVTDAAAYIRTHYRETLTLEATAAHFFISPSYLSRVFHRLTGFHFREYIVHIRMSEAQRLLSASDARIQDIASAVGFEYLSHFNKTFKKSTGLTPLQYRKQIQNRPGAAASFEADSDQSRQADRSD
ncbi:AraC family transcriptional regulator [Saccharibacillus sp. CPCC 101409]|uniref:helix-turn-helix transcriptional regulator n=1 Tax=Saccharibacillus sp. CPCC 101409 TaxID=3058041 RepID=UPI002673B20B|nr:AraC family transcriptional regulator [Saccharibacillus sp. CPCC 101409]MDO3412382.1 AraC family transcriptional regulator [Saccharibacillus sp. CPCC 101409]